MRDSLATERSSVWITAVAALVVYVHAVANGWAHDDTLIIVGNEAAHSLSGALEAFFLPYWDPGISGSGQYRPLSILFFALDWVFAGGSTVWFHAVNVFWHVIASVLTVLVLRPWLKPTGAVVAGVLFAIHPIHVEAVANVVGRSEIIVAAMVLAALLAARRFRTALDPHSTVGWGMATIFFSLTAMLTKENGVVAIGVIALDHWVNRDRLTRNSLTLYGMLVTVTVAWFYLWFSVAGDFVGASQAAAFRGLTAGQRLATVLPLQLEVIRLLAWPFDLASDYNPQMFPVFTSWHPLSVFAGTVCIAIVAVAFLVRRTAPAVSLGVFVSIAAYSPTSNFLFGSGIALAERNLYLSAIAPAAVIAFLVVKFLETEAKRHVILGVTVFIVALGWRTATQVLLWRDSGSLLFDAFVDHPENYRTRLRFSNLWRDRGRDSEAMAELMVATSLYPDDPYLSLWSVPRALRLGRNRLALQEANRSFALAQNQPRIAELVVRVHWRMNNADSAVSTARLFRDRLPEDPFAAALYAQALDSAGADQWRVQLAKSHENWNSKKLIGSSTALDSALVLLGSAGDLNDFCSDLEDGAVLVARLGSDAIPVFRDRLQAGLCEITFDSALES
ncbi:MAG: hypothetical protein OEY63_00835 [Gemmatimonadota bacterium]|nr:hypothetical protein [Gemmatimonadota bacterium]MDH5804768.1 hypothetical protein [Gemmatimonadota bacterium]